MAAMLLAALPAITAATLTPPLSPGDTMNAAFKAWASNVITMMNIQAWLNDAVPAGLALVLLVRHRAAAPCRNASLLRGDWSRLLLPRPLREIWQEHFPELGPG
jgi:hypothetical protein